MNASVTESGNCFSRLNYLDVFEEVFCFHFSFKEVIGDLS